MAPISRVERRPLYTPTKVEMPKSSARAEAAPLAVVSREHPAPIAGLVALKAAPRIYAQVGGTVQIGSKAAPTPALTKEAETEVKRFMAKHKDNKALFKAFADLAAGEGFRKASFPVQQQALRVLEKNASVESMKSDLKKLMNKDFFQQLPEGAQIAMLKVVKNDPHDINYPIDVAELTQRPGWSKLTDEAKAAAVRAFAEPARRTNIMDFIDRPEVALLSGRAQVKWIKALGDNNIDTTARVDGRLNEILDNDTYKGLGDDKKAFVLEKMSGPVLEPGTMEVEKGTWDRHQKDFKIVEKGEVKTKGFEDGERAKAIKCRVIIGDKKIDVYIRKNPSGDASEIPNIQQIAKALASMPEKNLAEIKEVYIEGKKNDDREDAFMLARPPGKVSVYLNSDLSHDAMTTSFVHESGHLMADREWGSIGKDGKGWQRYTEAIEKDQKWPSYYAGWSEDEDIAETMVLYQSVKGTDREEEARAKMPERFKLIDELLK